MNESNESNVEMKITKLQFAGLEPIQVEVPETPEERLAGLGNRNGIDQAGLGTIGMLFPRTKSVWMQPMRFPLDLVFLEIGFGSYLIRGIISPAPPGGTETYTCDRCTDVLELPAGWVKAHGVFLNQQVYGGGFPLG